MSAAPSLIPPRNEVSINPSLAYEKRSSAHKQAAAWNLWIREDPVLGPSSGFEVGVGERVDGRFPLVWVPTRGT